MGKVLLIDDNEIDLFIMKKMLEKYSDLTDISQSSDGAAALKNIAQNLGNESLLPDIILLDVNMPGWSGFEFLETFATMLDRIHKPIDVYIVTASLDPRDQFIARGYAFVKGYLLKPLAIELVKKLFQEHQIA